MHEDDIIGRYDPPSVIPAKAGIQEEHCRGGKEVYGVAIMMGGRCSTGCASMICDLSWMSFTRVKIPACAGMTGRCATDHPSASAGGAGGTHA